MSRITPVRREMVLRIFDGHVPKDLNYDPIGSPLYFLIEHLPERYLDKALIWLVSHNQVGPAFIKLFREDCKGLNVSFQKLMISIVDADIIRPLINGVGFIQ